MVPFPCLIGALQEVRDPRRRQGQRYPFTPLLMFTVLALLSGARSYRDIVAFIAQRRDQLNALFATRLRRAPSLNALRNLLHALDRAELEAAFRRHAQALRTPPAAVGDERPVIALDGKTMKRSFDHLNDRAAAVTLSAFACDDALVLAHTEVEAERDEILAAQQMIAELDVSGVLFTADALHCQKNAGGRPAQQ